MSGSHGDTLVGCDSVRPIVAANPAAPTSTTWCVGQVFDWAPSMTLTPGVAAAHQQILGDRLRLALDAELAHAVTGVPGALAHPALVCDVAIGQSTLVTQRVKANLFYRGLVFHRFPVIGDTLFTRTEVVGLKQNSDQTRPCADRPGGTADDHHRPGRPAGARLPPLRHAAAEPGRSRHRACRRPVADRAPARRRPPTRRRIGTPTAFRRAGARPALPPRSGRVGAAQQCRRRQLRTGAGPADPEYRCGAP